MSDTTEALRPIDGNGHMPAPPRHFSRVTCEYSIHIDYEGLTVLMDEVFDVWDAVEANGTSEKIGNMLGDLVERIAVLRSWTGWGGVPYEYTGQTL